VRRLRQRRTLYGRNDPRQQTGRKASLNNTIVRNAHSRPIICSCILAEVRIHEILTLVATVVLLGATTMFSRRALARYRCSRPQSAGRSGNGHRFSESDSQNQDNAPAAQSATTAASAPGQGVTAGAAPLRVMVGKSLLINTTERLKRVSVTDPSAWPMRWSSHPRRFWSTDSLRARFPADLGRTGALAQLRSSRGCRYHRGFGRNASPFPNEQISVTPSRNAIVLSGHVTTEDVAKHAGALASAYSKNVVNVLTFGPVGRRGSACSKSSLPKWIARPLTQIGINLLLHRRGKYHRQHNHRPVRRSHRPRTHHDTGRRPPFPNTRDGIEPAQPVFL
jgi:hypothetical protein